MHCRRPRRSTAIPRTFRSGPKGLVRRQITRTRQGMGPAPTTCGESRIPSDTAVKYSLVSRSAVSGSKVRQPGGDALTHRDGRCIGTNCGSSVGDQHLATCIHRRNGVGQTTDTRTDDRDVDFRIPHRCQMLRDSLWLIDGLPRPTEIVVRRDPAHALVAMVTHFAPHFQRIPTGADGPIANCEPTLLSRHEGFENVCGTSDCRGAAACQPASYRKSPQPVLYILLECTRYPFHAVP